MGHINGRGKRDACMHQWVVRGKNKTGENQASAQRIRPCYNFLKMLDTSSNRLRAFLQHSTSSHIRFKLCNLFLKRIKCIKFCMVLHTTEILYTCWQKGIPIYLWNISANDLQCNKEQSKRKVLTPKNLDFKRPKAISLNSIKMQVQIWYLHIPI